MLHNKHYIPVKKSTKLQLHFSLQNKRGSDSDSGTESTMELSSTYFSSTTTISSSGSSTSSLPPGPAGLPVVGSAMEFKGPQTNLKWTENYGPVYHVRMGRKNLVYLNKIDLVEKYMEGKNGEQFLNRPTGPAAFGEGLLFGNGDKWRKNKRAFMKAMHTATLLEDMEGSVQGELAIAMEQLHKKAAKSRPYRIGDAFLPACANVISGLLLGGSLPKGCTERESLHKIVRNLEGIDLTSSLTNLTMKYPRMREPLNKIFFKDIVDIHGTSRRLQRLIRHWIRQTRSGEIFKNQSGFYQPVHQSEPIQEPGKCPVIHHTPPEGEGGEKTQVAQGNGIRHKLSLSLPQNDNNVIINREENSEEVEDDRRENDTTTNDSQSEDGDDHDDDDDDENRLHPSSAAGRTNLTKHFISTESLLTVPVDQDRVEDIMQDETDMATFGFSSVGPGERPFEPVEPSALAECPRTPLTEFEWKFQREMSINERHDSILQRILAQPEFAGVTEENDAELLQSLVDMFFGGVTSTLSGLEFVLMYLSKNPNMQVLAQQEISRVLAAQTADAGTTNGVAGSSHITWSMRDKMPYMRACIVEALRLGSVTPSSLPHVASVDAEVEGYAIPKNTFVLASIYSMHRDPQEFIDPHDFRPQRHLDADQKFCLPRSYRPYGIGARLCVGERLAEMELFLYATAILRDFNVLSAPGAKKASAMETHMRIVHRLKDFKCVLQKKKR